MTYESSQLKRVRYYIEPESSYAIDNQANLATQFSDIKVTEFSYAINVEQLENATMMQRLDRFREKINSRRRSEATLTTYLNGTGVTASYNVTATSNPVGALLKATMGGEYLSKGSGLISAGTANYICNLSNSVRVGGAVGVVNPTTNRLVCTRVIATGSTTTAITTSVGFGFSPTSGSVVYGSSNYYLGNNPSTSVQLYVDDSNEEDDHWNLLGLQGGFSLDMPIGELPTITFDFKGASWASGSNVAILQNATYSDATPPPFVDGMVYFNSINTNLSGSRSAMSPIDVQSFELTPNISYIEILSERGVNNILRMRRQRSIPIASGKFVTYYDDTTYWRIKENVGATTTNAIRGTRFADIGIQIGTLPGQTVFISMPQCQITNVQKVDAGGLNGVEVSFDVHEPEYAAYNPVFDTDVDLNYSAFTIHLL